MIIIPRNRLGGTFSLKIAFDSVLENSGPSEDRTAIGANSPNFRAISHKIMVNTSDNCPAIREDVMPLRSLGNPIFNKAIGKSIVVAMRERQKASTIGSFVLRRSLKSVVFIPQKTEVPKANRYAFNDAFSLSENKNLKPNAAITPPAISKAEI